MCQRFVVKPGQRNATEFAFGKRLGLYLTVSVGLVQGEVLEGYRGFVLLPLRCDHEKGKIRIFLLGQERALDPFVFVRKSTVLIGRLVVNLQNLT